MTGLRSNRTFIRLFLGRIVTNAGDSMYIIAATWLVWDLTGSSFYTGIAGFLVFGVQPLQFLVGPLVDRWPLERILVGTQVVQGVGVLIVPLAAATGHLSVWLVLILLPALEFLSRFVYPAQNAALPRIVDDDQLVRANSLFSLAYQGVDLTFNAITGVLIAAIGAVSIYVVNGVTFAIALAFFLGVSVPRERDDPDEDEDSTVRKYLSELREGLRYVRDSVIFDIILGAVVVNFAFGMMTAVLPAFADSLGGSEAYGFLMAAMAGGTLVGAASASFFETYSLGRVQIVGFSLTAVFWAAALAVPGLWPTVVLFFVAFAPSGAVNVMSSSMIQSAVDDTFIGRVTSVRTSFSTLMMPVGSLLGGTAAGTLGSTTVLSGMVYASAILALYYFVRPRLRTLPPVAEADEGSLGLKTNIDVNESSTSAGGPHKYDE